MPAAERGTGRAGGPFPSGVPGEAPERSRILKYLPGVGPRRADLLQRLGVVTVDDLLHHFPRRYEDRRNLARIAGVVAGDGGLQGQVVLHGELASVRERILRSRRALIEARLVDLPAGGKAGVREGERDLFGSRPGAIDLVWFNQRYLLEWLQPGTRLFVYGQVRIRNGRPQMTAPEFEIDADSEDGPAGASPHMQRIVPIYPLTKGLSQRFIRGLVFRGLEESLPGAVRGGRDGASARHEGPYDLFHPEGISLVDAFRGLHFPDSWKDLALARSRFVFDEYFAFASNLFFRRRACRREGPARFAITPELDRKIRSVFPFRLTKEQDRVIGEISQDLGGSTCMYRLLQGDVGTGKTVVAMHSMLVTVRNRHQAALMVPTEILAEQHHRTLSRALSKHPVRIALLTGSVRGAERRALLDGIARGTEHIVVGTHALVQEGVEFKRLGLVVIDEQHRFGVLDRMRIRRKGENPHVLVMTATPIPRSLCLTCYGDLDLSLLGERPQGRKPVKTLLVAPRQRPRAMEFIRKQLEAGRQAFFIYPLIEESEALTLPAAVKAHEDLSQRVFPGWPVGLVHGDLSAAEKEKELGRFRGGEYRVLVATVVVEVGIDVPNATVLFIEDASRFGLAQLHQLRGRVGRGDHPGYCLVGLDSSSAEVRQRLKVFASTEDGFRIAEEDLKLRGPGDFLGVRQSGRPHFLLGNPLEDLAEFLRVRALADQFWSRQENAGFRRAWRGLLGEEKETEAEGGQGFLGLD